MTMIVSGSDGLEFPDGSDQTVAYTGNASTITSGTLPAAQLPSSGVNAASITTGVLLQAYGGTGTTVGYNGFKNRLINGQMVIDQRNAGASVTPTSLTYTVDRWAAAEQTDGSMTVQQSAVVPAGFTNSLLTTITSADSSLGGTQYAVLRQAIEGFNVADLGWGSANAQTVTLSFWVRSSVTGTFGGSLQNSAQDRSYPFSYTVSSANTFEYKTVTITGDTTGTWLTTNGTGINLWLGLGIGSTYSGTAGAWAAGLFFAPTGAVNLHATNGATFYITGVQLEKGSTATSFDYRPYGTELQLCQRYYERGAVENLLSFCGNVTSSVTYYTSVLFVVPKRATPTVTNANQDALGFPSTASSTGVIDSTGIRFARTANSSTNGAYFNDSWQASAEL